MEVGVGGYFGGCAAGLGAVGEHAGRPPHHLPLHRPAQPRRARGGQEDLHGPDGGLEEDAEKARGPI